MTGELFEVKDNNLRVVTLDGHRISIRTIELKESYEPIKVIVPGKTLNEISKILSAETDENVSIFFTDNHILFEFDNTRVVSRLLEGEYYKISQMLSHRLLLSFNPSSAHHISLLTYHVFTLTTPLQVCLF